MSQLEQLLFLELVADANHDLVAGGAVLEVGRPDVEGSIRRIFAGAADYVGFDETPGLGLDIDVSGRTLELPDGALDLALSAGSLASDLYWATTLATMVRVTRPGGVVTFSCTGGHRPVRERDVRARLRLDEDFGRFGFWRNRWSRDLYFVGVRSGDAQGRPVGRLPDSAAVNAIQDQLGSRNRDGRFPLRALATVLPESASPRLAAPFRRRFAFTGRNNGDLRVDRLATPAYPPPPPGPHEGTECDRSGS